MGENKKTDKEKIRKQWMVPNPEGKVNKTANIVSNLLFHRIAKLYIKVHGGGFPGGSVVGTPCFHCRRHRFDPWLGSQDPSCCLRSGQKKSSQ